MKFIFADSLDTVDPRYDFITDRSPSDREIYWGDNFPHEILGHAPYDGILVSRGIADKSMPSARYSESQSRRFRIVGGRKFLRFEEKYYPGSLLFGDCGAFSYHKDPVPPYSPENMLEFYEDGGFTHGCSVDHIIFDFDKKLPGLAGGTEENRRRYDITLENAAEFLKASKRLGNQFTPMGVVQGWSPGSMAEAARRLKAMGYSYLAIGGMVPLKSADIHQCLDAIRDAAGTEIQIHILGFAKADDIHEFARYGISSFDTTSPLLRSFKDQKSNYYLPKEGTGLTYYSAIRIPQALENPKLMRGVKSGALDAEMLVKRETAALSALRQFDRDELDLENVLEIVLEYGNLLSHEETPAAREKKLGQLRERYRRTLDAKPWKQCDCAICKTVGVEVIIFRSSNRNKRRGIHNLDVFGKYVRRLNERGDNAY